MTGQPTNDPQFDYKLYRFGRSQRILRGPAPDLHRPYVACLGGTGTFGRFTDAPFPQLLGKTLGISVLNLGTEGAGPGFFIDDREMLRLASTARVCVVQVMCATAISNRMFTVRPRRNNRLNTTSSLLASVFPEVDLAGFNNVPALLTHLATLDESRFQLVINEMKNAWIGRTLTLLAAIETKTLLLWFSQRGPDEMPGAVCEPVNHPHFVDRAMIDTVRPAANGYVECVYASGPPQNPAAGDEMALHAASGAPIDQSRTAPSPQMHQAAAAALAPKIEQLWRR